MPETPLKSSLPRPTSALPPMARSVAQTMNPYHEKIRPKIASHRSRMKSGSKIGMRTNRAFMKYPPISRRSRLR